MTATIHGEIAADGKTLVLIAAGSDRDVAFAAKKLGLITPLCKPTVPRGGMQLPLTWPACVQLAETFGADWTPGARLTAWLMAEVRRRVSVPPGPPVTNAQGWTPRPYQLEAAAMIAATGRALLFDEPGTGKSASTVLGLAQRHAAGHPVFPALVVAPASVVDPWLEQWAAWAPQFRALAWRGTPAQRLNLRGAADVYVASYDTVRIDTVGGAKKSDNPLLSLGLQAVVADECHLIKTPSTGRSRAVRKLGIKAACFVGLSGTPITHHPADLWPTLEALVPDAWPSGERWRRRYCDVIQGDYKEEVLGLRPAAEAEFRRALVGQHRRVAKVDVLTQLPPKVYSVRSVELPTAARRAYDQMEEEMLATLEGEDGELQEMSVMDTLAQLTRLSQLACASADVELVVEQVEDPPGSGQLVEKVRQKVTLRRPSWKVDALLEVLAERPGRPVIATAPSRQLITLAGEAAAEAGLRVGWVVGGQRAQDRTHDIAAFQAGELDLICVTTQAGGVGITLTAADTVVFLQRPWSLVDSIQMEDRAHRIGSERHDSIEIIDIVAKNTIDTRVRQALRDKAGQLADLVQDPRLVEELLGGNKLKRAAKAA